MKNLLCRQKALTSGCVCSHPPSLGYVFINRKNNRGIWFALTEFVL